MPTIKRGTHTLHTQTAANISKSYSSEMLQNQNLSQYDHANPNYARVRGTRTCRTDAQLPFHVLSGTQVRSNLPSYFKFEKTKPVRSSQAVSTIQSLPCTKFCATTRLDGQTRSEPSIFPRAYCTAASQVPEAKLSSKFTSTSATPDDVFAVWPLIGTQNVCLDNQLGSRIPEKSQYQVRSLFRRFSFGQPVKIAVGRRHRIHDQDTPFTRLDNQLREVCTGSDTMPRVSRHYMGHKTQRKVPVGTKVPNATQGTSPTASVKQVVPQTVPNTNGETQLCNVRDSERSPSLSNSAILQSTAVGETPVSVDHAATTSSIRAGVVVSSHRKVNADTLELSDVTTIDHRRIRHRMGGSTRRHKYCGHLDRVSEDMACQQKRDVCRLRSYTSEPAATPRCTDTASNRQSNSSLVHKQGGRHKIQEAASSNSTTSCCTRQAEHSSDSTLFSGQVQCRGRCSFSAEGLSRMATHEDSNDEHFSNVGYAGDRPLRVENSPRSTKVRIAGRQRSGSPTSQRVLSSVALRPSLVVSTTKFDSTSSPTPEPIQRRLYIDCPEVEQGVLAGRCSTTSATSPLPNSRSSLHSRRHQNGDASAASARPTLGSMADFGWQDILTDWTDQEQKFFMSSWRGSTINTYRPVWGRWKRWCESHSINFKYPNADQVARYLAHLHCDIGLAYRTILVHKSVISTFTHITSNIDLSSNFFIKHILKAISVAREKSAKPPIWNPKVLLQHLSAYDFDENNIFQVSRHVATLLLLASGRRVHDLTLLRIDSSSLVDEDSSIVLWPAFGSKTDNHNHRQSGWRLKEHPDKKLNLIFWLRQLIDITSNCRGNIKHLFITVRGDIKPASRTVIGGWVRSLLKAAGIDATPGSVRSAVASLNFVENFPIDQILATGNWKTIHTFQNYYQRELLHHNDSNVPNHSTSLSNYFDPVQ